MVWGTVEQWSSQEGGDRVQVSSRWPPPELASAARCLERTEWEAHSQALHSKTAVTSSSRVSRPEIQKTRVEGIPVSEQQVRDPKQRSKKKTGTRGRIQKIQIQAELHK